MGCDFAPTQMVLTFSLFEGQLLGFRGGDVLEWSELIGLSTRAWFLLGLQIIIVEHTCLCRLSQV